MCKDDLQAIRFLLKANFLYEERRYCEALIAYNRSLCYAETGTEIASLCYGKRSIVYFDLKEYELCIANIELAEQTRPTEVGAVKFDDLKSECQELMITHIHEPDENPMNFFKLTYPPNSKLPCLSDCLKLCVDKRLGRHIITTCDLNVGDIVAVTDFSFIFFDKRARLHHCSHCTASSTKLSLIPCLGCAKTMYCSLECMAKDLRKFHQYECGTNIDPEQDNAYNPLKILVHILDHFDDNVDEMKKFLDAAYNKPRTVFDFDLSDRNSSEFDKNMILATLSTSESMNCTQKGKEQCLTTHHRFIMQHPKLRSLWMSPHKQYLDELLCKLLDVEDLRGLISCFTEIDMNLKEKDCDPSDVNIDGPSKIGNIYVNQVAHVIDPYMILMNQSCFPNVSTKFVNNQHAWIVVRPLKAGEQLTMFRGPGVKYVTPRIERQQMLLEYFGYKCECEGCENYWPIQQQMVKLTEVERLVLYLKHLHLICRIGTPKSDVYAQYLDYTKRMQGMAKFFPCFDYVYLEHKLMFNIYRLAQPAKWFSRTGSSAEPASVSNNLATT